MKKVLFATTALVLTAGIAAAEVKVSGDGRMGVVYDGDNANFNSRIRAIFTLSGETDGGLAFGGSFRADNAGDAANGSAGSIFISGAFGKLAMGDTDGALENAVGDLSGVGYSYANDIMSSYETFYLTAASTSNPIALYSYEVGDFGFYASLLDGHTGGNFSTTKEEGYSVGLTYAFGDFGIAAGYESVDLGGVSDADQWMVSGTGTFSGLGFKAIYGQGDNFGDDFKQYGASVDYTFGATTLTALARVVDFDSGLETKIYGIGANYDLGGGAALRAGILDIEDTSGLAAFDDTVADFGVVFTF